MPVKVYTEEHGEILTRHGVLIRAGVCERTLYEYAARDRAFPKSFRLIGFSGKFWKAAEVDTWLSARL